MSCVHKFADRCNLGLFGGKPSDDDCDSCDQYSGPDRGLGDRVHSALSTFGVDRIAKAVMPSRGCGCGKRRAKLNQLVPTQRDSDGS